LYTYTKSGTESSALTDYPVLGYVKQASNVNYPNFCKVSPSAVSLAVTV